MARILSSINYTSRDWEKKKRHRASSRKCDANDARRICININGRCVIFFSSSRKTRTPCAIRNFDHWRGVRRLIGKQKVETFDRAVTHLRKFAPRRVFFIPAFHLSYELGLLILFFCALKSALEWWGLNELLSSSFFFYRLEHTHTHLIDWVPINYGH